MRGRGGFFDIVNNYDLEEIYINGINTELINTYFVIKNDVQGIINFLKKYQEEYIPLYDDDRKIYYYEKREEFNNVKIDEVDIKKLL